MDGLKRLRLSERRALFAVNTPYEGPYSLEDDAKKYASLCEKFYTQTDTGTVFKVERKDDGWHVIQELA